MPTFDTPQPITVTLSLLMADVRINASDRADTVVEVRPANPSTKSARVAEETRVEYADGRLLVKTPKHLNSLFGRPGGIDVDIHLPAGSSLDGDVGLGELHGDGRLGECRYKTGYGAVRLAHTGPLRVTTGAGDIAVERVDGDAEVSTGTGRLTLGRIDGAAVVKSSNGEVNLGEVTGAVRVRAANGSVSLDRAVAGATLKTAHGGLRIGEAVRGSVVLETAAGRIEVGIPHGTAAWLDLNTPSSVRNSLDSTGGPLESDERLEVRARTYLGDIVIHRS
jgi:DUF4097 and DUF4098 domain-containing protein YvlB